MNPPHEHFLRMPLNMSRVATSYGKNNSARLLLSQLIVPLFRLCVLLDFPSKAFGYSQKSALSELSAGVYNRTSSWNRTCVSTL